MDERFQVNIENWNERTPIHAASGFYDVDGFKSGRISLNDIELREMGDVTGKTLLHLQCHFGMDTMSWARLGALATGADFSAAAIDLARTLNVELGLNARFICANVYNLPDVLDGEFDIVFTSYGVLAWLPDLAGWASVVERFLRPGGTFYIVDFHPLMGVFEPDCSGKMIPVNGYFHEEIFFGGGRSSYTGTGLMKSAFYQWQHSLGEIVTALIDAGLRIEFLHEFPFCGYRAFLDMEQGGDGWWRFPKCNDSIPQMFSIKAAKAAPAADGIR